MGAPAISNFCRRFCPESDLSRRRNQRRLAVPAHLNRPLILILAVAAVCLLAIAAPACQPAYPDANGPHSAMTINRIAYIDADGQLTTVNPDGSRRQQLTLGAVADAVDRIGGIVAQPLAADRLYSWPAWSPDGARIAVSQIDASQSGPPEISVRSLESATGVGGPVFVNADPIPIADGAPHYVQWSPNGRHLGITAATRDGLTLFVADGNLGDGIRAPANPVAVRRGSPLYFNWSPDSRSLAVHSGEEVLALHFDAAFTQATVQPIGQSRSFRTPVWSPDGAQLAWSGPGGDSEALWISRPAQTDYPPLRLAEVDGDCAFLWSPDGAVIAVADRQSDGSPAYRRLRLIAADGSQERIIQQDDWTLAFFWAPTGRQLAWVALNTEERAMEWRIDPGQLDAPDAANADDTDSDDNAADTPAGGLQFSPTGTAFLMLAFFDQYASSHTPWAPDGSALTIAGDQHYLSQRRNGSSSGGPRIFVAGATDGSLHNIAGGSLSVWSPR